MTDNSVIIIGGGISGLAAAAQLLEHGRRITLLEAKPGLGGRILSIPGKNGPLELGAEFIHGRSPELMEAIREMGIKTKKFPDQHRLFMAGKIQKKSVFENIEKVIGAIDPKKSDLPFSKFVAAKKMPALTRRLALDFATGFEASDPAQLSSHSMLWAQNAAEKMHGDWQGYVPAGYSALVEALRKKIDGSGGAIICGARVARVIWKPGAVTVHFRHRGKMDMLKAASAVVTLPIGAWKRGILKFLPPLPEKTEAARKFGFGNVVKLILVFKTKWWPKSFSGFVHAPDEPFPTWWTSPRGSTITAWAGGTRTISLNQLSAHQLHEKCLHSLARIFSTNLIFIQSQLESFHLHDWARDPETLGAYSYLPVNGLDLPYILAAPVANTLFFAGEATVFDCQTGTVFGAFESGRRAAREILTVN